MLTHHDCLGTVRAGLILLSFAPAVVSAQSPAEWKAVLERLDQLERQNQTLQQEVAELKEQVTNLQPRPQAEETWSIVEQRVTEQAQTKVEASQRFPLRITGMALFNAFLNTRFSGGADNPVLASLSPGNATGGATVRQTVIGLEYQGPATLWGGKVQGSFYMDFFSGTGDSLNQQARVRTASIEVDWKSRSILVGQQKAIFNPREPTSLSQVGVSPLTGAGNLWRWDPQIRFEQRFNLGGQTNLRAQVGFIQTTEDTSSVPTEYTSSASTRRPGFEGRFLLTHNLDDMRRIEVAPGFHTSDSHLLGVSVPSNLFSLDWFANPWRKLEFTGAFFSGQNVGHFGPPRQGFTVLPDYSVIPVHSRGGWAQFSFLATSRLSFNLMGGVNDDRNRDLLTGQIGNNTAGAVNAMYKLAPNVLVGLEASQVRTDYLGFGLRINNHYDLALAYKF